MVVMAPGSTHQFDGTAPRTPNSRTMHHYHMFQMAVASEIRLPVAEARDMARELPDVTIVVAGGGNEAPQPGATPGYELRCYCAQHAGLPIMRVYADTTGSWVWAEDAGVCVITADGRRVDIYTDLDTESESRLAHLLTGTVAHLMSYHRLGIPALHGSAVVLGNHGVAFVGPKGQGKSTMAAGFLERGATLLTDDVLPLQMRDARVFGLPGLALMKLWDESVLHALHLDGSLPTVVPNFDKKAVDVQQRHAVAQEPVPMRALYVLQRYDPERDQEHGVSIQALRPHEGLLMLLAQIPLRKFLPPTAFSRMFPLLGHLVQQAPVRVLHYPSGFEHQAQVHDAIQRDTEVGA